MANYKNQEYDRFNYNALDSRDYGVYDRDHRRTDIQLAIRACISSFVDGCIGGGAVSPRRQGSDLVWIWGYEPVGDSGWNSHSESFT